MDGHKDAYLAKAEEAERMAAEVEEPAKQHWRDLARGWRELATRAGLVKGKPANP
jgi:hypothetical protein